MKTYLHVICTAIAALVLHSCSTSPVLASIAPIRWTTEASMNRPFNTTIAQGETRDLICTIKNYGAPVVVPYGASATMHYQTNGMGRLYWPGGEASVTSNGVITATWTPALDCGAAAYQFTLGITSGSNKLYSAYGVIRMRTSPGAVPNEIPIPPRVIDFGAVTVLNPPWATPADLAPATNALALASTALQPAATNGLLRAEADTLATVTARGAMTTNAVTIGVRGLGPVGVSSFAQGKDVIASGEGSHAEGYSATAGGDYSHAEGLYTTASGDYSHAEGYSTTASGNYSHAGGAGTFASGNYSHAEGNLTTASGRYSHASGFKAYIPVTDHGAFAWQGTDGSFSEKKYNSHGPGTYNLNPRGGLAGFWIGETNMATTLSGYATPGDVAAAGASIIEDIFSVTNALLVVSNGVATVETNGVPVWSSASGGGSVPPSVTNELWQSIAALQGTVASLQGTVAALSHAWGEYAPDGSPNPDPDYMLWINRPATVWGAGFQWAVSGGHAVLTATGTVAFASGGSGEMRIGPGDGTNYFGFVTGGSVEVGASASGISVADDVATIIYPYETGDFPTLWFTADLATPFEVMSGVVWVDNADGTATVTAPATTARGFWRATTLATFASEFQSTMPARFTGGVWGAADDFPVKYDSTITIQSGGKSYRIVAEEVR